MYLEIEGGTLVNLDEITTVEFIETRKIVNLWSCGVIIVAESHIAWRYFKESKDLNIITLPPEKA